MKEEKLLDLVDQIDDRCIEEASQSRKRPLRKWVALAACVTLCLCGALVAYLFADPYNNAPVITDGIYSENESYKMYIEDGKWYIELKEEVFDSVISTNDFYISVVARPFYDSAADMKKVLTSKELPDGFIKTCKGWFVEDGRKRLEIGDPNKICELKTPEGLTYDAVGVDVTCYGFHFNKGETTGTIYTGNKESYDRSFEKEYVSFPSNGNMVTSETTTEERNARIVFSSNSVTDQKHIFYKITAGESEIYVIEQYILKYYDVDDEDEDTSDTVPSKIYLYGNDGANYWFGWFRGVKERPTVEWLSSFGLEPIK